MNTGLLVVSLLTGCKGFSVPQRSTLSTPQQTRNFEHAVRFSTALQSSVSSNAELLSGIAAIDEANNVISEQLAGLRDTPYFRFYSVDILASCEYMPQELFECYSETCEVYPVDDDEVRLSFS